MMTRKMDNINGLVWSGLVWSGLVWSGLVWSGLDNSVRLRLFCQYPYYAHLRRRQGFTLSFRRFLHLGADA